MVGAWESAEYRYARTLAHDPHYYTVRRDWRGEMPFDEVVRALRARSEARPYFDANGYQYWTMAARVDETVTGEPSAGAVPNEIRRARDDV